MASLSVGEALCVHVHGVAAFRLSDGPPMWSRQITTTPGQGVDIQTEPYGGLVFVASVPVGIGKIYTGGSVGYLMR